MAPGSEYKPLRSSFGEDEEKPDEVGPRLDGVASPNASRRLSLCTILLTGLNFLLLLVSVTMVYAVSTPTPQEPRFATDFAGAQRTVRYEQRTYSQQLFYNETSEQVEREMDPHETLYFGDPSPEIDAAWEELLYG